MCSRRSTKCCTLFCKGIQAKQWLKVLRFRTSVTLYFHPMALHSSPFITSGRLQPYKLQLNTCFQTNTASQHGRRGRALRVAEVATAETAEPYIPERKYLDDEPDHVWRNGKPDYTVVNQAYLSGKTRNWVAGSLEAVVESVVKTLEMEISHKTRPEYIKTFTPDFRYSQNGGPAIDTAELISRGSYNVLINDASYTSQNFDFEGSHDAFKEAFPGGFAWECLDVLAGPPKVTFKWRHWGQFTGQYAGHAPTGETIELHGMAIATVTDNLQVERLEIFYDPTPFLDSLAKGGASKCPFMAGSSSK